MASLDFDFEKQNFTSFYDDQLESHKARLKIITHLLEAILQDKFIGKVTVSSRLKAKEECLNKFSRKYQAKQESLNENYEIKNFITDLYGLRVVCHYEDDIEKIVEIFKHEFDVIEITNKIKQVESENNLFGYKGVHLDVGFKQERLQMVEYDICGGCRFEIQIRTITQDAWSTIDHSINYKKEIPQKLSRRVMTLAALFELADREFLSIRVETEKYIESLRNGSTFQDNEINSLNFKVFIDKYSKNNNLKPFSIDLFISNLKGFLKDDEILTIHDCEDIYLKYHQKIDDYEKYLLRSELIKSDLNFITKFRHILFLKNNEQFKNILFNQQRDNFNIWNENNILTNTESA